MFKTQKGCIYIEDERRFCGGSLNTFYASAGRLLRKPRAPAQYQRNAQQGLYI